MMRWVGVLGCFLWGGLVHAQYPGCFGSSSNRDGQACSYPEVIYQGTCINQQCCYVGNQGALVRTGTGTITSTSGATVTGTGTIFLSELNVGDTITEPLGTAAVVVTISDDTHLTLATPGFSPDVTNVTFTLAPSVLRVDATTCVPLVLLTRDGRLTLGVGTPGPFLGVVPPTPPTRSSGSGGVGIDGAIIQGGQGGDTTAPGAAGGIGGVVSLSAGPSGRGPADGTIGQDMTFTAGTGGVSTAASGKTCGAGGSAYFRGASGGACASGNTNGAGGPAYLQGGNAGGGAGGAANGAPAIVDGGAQFGGGTDGNVTLASLRGNIVGGVNKVTVPRLQVFSSTTDVSVSSITDVDVLVVSVLTQAGRTESFHAGVRINDTLAAAHDYICTLRRGGTSCVVGSTLVTDSTGNVHLTATSTASLVWTATEASPGTATTIYRMCCKSDVATIGQTTLYEQLDVLEL